MFKIVASSLAFVLLVAVTVFVIKKAPQVQSLAECYEETHAIYTQKYIVSRRAYTKDEDICEDNKKQILKGAQCFYREENRLEVLESELPYLKQIAKSITRASKELDEVVEDHNSKCNYEDSQILPHELRDLEQR